MTAIHPTSEIFKTEYAQKTLKVHVGMCQFYTDP